MIRLLLELLDDALAGRPVLERELGDDSAEFVGFGVLHPMQRYPEPKHELVETIYDAPVHDPQHDYPFGAVGQKVRHPAKEVVTF